MGFVDMSVPVTNLHRPSLDLSKKKLCVSKGKGQGCCPMFKSWLYHSHLWFLEPLLFSDALSAPIHSLFEITSLRGTLSH